MGLVDGHLDGRAVDLAGRSVNDPLGAVLTRRFEHIQGAENVRFDIGLRSHIGMRYRDQCCQMEDDLVTSYEAADKGRIADVAANNIDPRSDVFRHIVQPAMTVE